MEKENFSGSTSLDVLDLTKHHKVRIIKTLACNAEVRNLAELCFLTRAEFLRIPGMGRKYEIEVREALSKLGLSFRKRKKKKKEKEE